MNRDLRVGFKYPVTPTEMKKCLLEYARGASPADAARKSGVPLSVFNLYREQDNFSGDLRKVLKGLVADVYAPKAFQFLYEVVVDAEMPARVRVDSAKVLLDRAGYTAAPLPSEPDRGDITQLSGAELHRLVIDLKAQRDKAIEGAKDVTPLPGATSAGEDCDEDESAERA
jgi:hypothetical protein